jgi:hypothetical protein
MPYVLREGQAPPPPRPRRFKARPPDDLGTIRRISAHRRTGRLQADGLRAQLQYFVHWEGLPPHVRRMAQGGRCSAPTTSGSPHRHLLSCFCRAPPVTKKRGGGGGGVRVGEVGVF